MRYAIVGCGSRHRMFRTALTSTYADRHQLVALCDSNAVRLNLSLAEAPGAVGYPAADYNRMLAEQRPDVVIVTTPDHTHAGYILPALHAGCDVICEKPLATTPEDISAIMAAERDTGRRVTVAFNYRYAPARTQIRQLLAAGTIGTVTAVDFRWNLDQIHGADYFRRWHRIKGNSGGMLVHKASHHFDLLNWWLATTPTDVTATGTRRFYTDATARQMDLSDHGDRCATCPALPRCGLALRLAEDPNLHALYQTAEAEDGYLRDRCVFAPEVEIEDTYQAHIRYASGASCNYTLITYAPWEGLEVRFTGTLGELTHRHTEVHGIFGGLHRVKMPDQEIMETTLHLTGQAPQPIAIPPASGGHGGADPLMLDDLFLPRNAVDTDGRASNGAAGAWAILTGIAAGRAIDSRQPQDIAALFAAL